MDEPTVDALLELKRRDIESEVNSPRWKPYFGFHEDHTGQPVYLPALQQVRSEFYALVNELIVYRLNALRPCKCLQLGLGMSGASHEVWRHLFDNVITIDLSQCLCNHEQYTGLDTKHGVQFASRHAPYDFLFIDAGHLYDDVRSDFELYSPLVRLGGIIAFHDAIQRVPGVDVWRFLEDHVSEARFVGDKIGTAWFVKN